MALVKSITQPSTVVTKYHRIRQIISLVWSDEGGHAEIWGEQFATTEARNDGATPVDETRFDCSLTTGEAAIIKRELYRAVKREYMADATDHIGPDDTTVAAMVSELNDDELAELFAAVDSEITSRKDNHDSSNNS